MSKKVPLYLVAIMLIFSNIFASGQVKVAEIALGNTESNNFIETLHLKIIDLDNTHLTTVLDQSQAKLLRSKNIQFSFLSKNYSKEDLYIVNINPKLNKTAEVSSKNIVYKGVSTLLVDSDISELSLRGVTTIPLSKLKRTFKNEKQHYNHVQSDVLDSLIAGIVSKISAESVQGYIQGLQDFGTRFLRHPNRKEVALWIKSEFELMGYTEVELDSFLVGGLWQYNVVAELPAANGSDEVVVVGGHHDSITQESLNNTNAPAPGADDNASGTTAVLETARVLMEAGFESDVNIKFVTFAAEELGLYGSFEYAENAADLGTKIRFMINHDMISSTDKMLEQSIMDINHYSGSGNYRDLALANVEKFTVVKGKTGSLNSSGSDSYAFWANGFDAVYFEESDFSDYYHTAQDLIENYSMEFCAEVIKASAATLISGSVTPSNVQNFAISDIGNGTSLLLSWLPNAENDVTGYKIYVGTSEGNYEDVYETTQSEYTLENLNEGTAYFIGITSVDDDGFESFIIERSEIPQSLPRSPANFTANPVWQAVDLSWEPNEELDLAGYNVYRSGIDTDEILKLNESILTDTSFIDNTTQSGYYYEYQVKAVDDQQNESSNTEFIISRSVTLDQGILFVDETSDGDGSFLNPTDDEVDNYFADLLSDYQYDQFDVQVNQKATLADLGAYGTVIWAGNDYSDLKAEESLEDIAEYLDYGGNFFFNGFRAASNFGGSSAPNVSYNEGDFLFDYLQVTSSKYGFLAKFNSAEGNANGYFDMNLDNTKMTGSSDGHLNNIESIAAGEGSTDIYLYGTDYDPSDTKAALLGEPVGVEYIGEDYKTVILGFPLYYMDQTSASNVVRYVLSEKFGLTTGVENESEVPSHFSLKQNYPNPFNPTTNIEYQVASIEKVSIKVYDILGREIQTLVNEIKSPGTYKITFDASKLSSGVYFYTLKAGAINSTKKLLLLK